MLKRDGAEAYKLDPRDYTYRENGGSCWMMNIKLPADGLNWHMGASLFCVQP